MLDEAAVDTGVAQLLTLCFRDSQPPHDVRQVVNEVRVGPVVDDHVCDVLAAPRFVVEDVDEEGLRRADDGEK